MRTAGGGRRRRELDGRERGLPVGGFCEFSVDANTDRYHRAGRCEGHLPGTRVKVRHRLFRGFINKSKKQMNLNPNLIYYLPHQLVQQ